MPIFIKIKIKKSLELSKSEIFFDQSLCEVNQWMDWHFVDEVSEHQCAIFDELLRVFVFEFVGLVEVVKIGSQRVETDSSEPTLVLGLFLFRFREFGVDAPGHPHEQAGKFGLLDGVFVNFSKG
jgi:hypothetical protein